MSFAFRPAKRENVGLLLGLAGGTGSGKTMSALRLAKGLAGDQPFCVIDTEAGRAKHYADMFQFDHGDLTPPFTPARYGEAIAAADEAGYPVIVVDSASHEHAGDGGLLDMQMEDFEKAGGRESARMSSWIRPKMEHKRFVSKLLQVRAHLILAFRAEEKIEIVKDGGKTVVRPKHAATGLDGWVPIAEKSLPFELTASFLLLATQPGIPHPIKLPEQLRRLIPLDQPISEKVGVALAHWSAGDSVPAGEHDDRIRELTDELLACADVLGNRQQVTGAVAKNRRANATDLERHVEWLESQLQRLSDAATAREQEQIDIPTDEQVTA